MLCLTIENFLLNELNCMSNDANAGSDQPRLNELITLATAAKLSGLSSGHLRLLVRTNELWGQKLGRNWFTTQQAVQEYLARNIKPGPKPN